MSQEMTVAVCLKWVDQRPELDSARLPIAADDRFAGISLADQAALEMALRSGQPTTAITVGPASAERALRDAAACGASRLVRINSPAPLDSATVATAISKVVGDARVVWCGDSSLDRGTGSVPPFLAAELGAAQLLGLVDAEDDGLTISATRRLDGGRRELLRSSGRSVCSVEGSVATLRRAGLAATITARSAAIEVIDIAALCNGVAAAAGAISDATLSIQPYRPRARAFAPPAGQTALDRVRSLILTEASGSTSESVVLDPPAAAARIIQALGEWGYLNR